MALDSGLDSLNKATKNAYPGTRVPAAERASGSFSQGAPSTRSPYQSRVAGLMEWPTRPDGSPRGSEAASSRFTQRFMGESLAESFRLADVEQAGIDEAKAMFRQEMPGVMASPLDDRDVGNLYAGMLEDIARQKASDMAAVTEHTGAAGLRGGVAADLAAQVELGALGAVSRGMRDMRQIQTQVEAQHKLTQLNAMGLGAQVLSQPPSTLAQQALADATSWYGTRWMTERGARAQREGAEAAKSGNILGGILGGVGQIAQGAIPFL